MTCNVGGVDRAVRAVLGIAFILIAIFVPMNTIWRVVLFVLAATALFTVATRYCPLNSVIGINACQG